MKHCKVSLFVLVNICFCLYGECQTPSPTRVQKTVIKPQKDNNKPPDNSNSSSNTNTYPNNTRPPDNNNNNEGNNENNHPGRKGFLRNLLGAVTVNLNDTSKKNIPTEKNERINYEFKRQKIYPSADALELLYVLNPWLEKTDDISQNTEIKMPDFPKPEKSLKKKMKEDYRAAAKTDAAANILFDSLTELSNKGMDGFLQRFNAFTKDHEVDASQVREFIDTLKGFTYQFLPVLKQLSGNICKAKMDYNNRNLADFANLLNSSEKLNSETLTVIQYIIRDFLTTNDIRFKTFGRQYQKTIFINASYTLEPGTSGQVFLINSNDGGTSYADSKALRCNVYIYTPSGEVIKGRFRVYFAPYVTVYNMDKCQDIEQCLHDRECIDAREASTAGAVIPNNSNWAIYCIDKNKKSFLVNEEYNYQNIVNRDDTDEESFKILLIYHGNTD